MSGGRAGGATAFVAAAFALLATLVALTPLVAHAAVDDLTLVSRGAADASPANGNSGPGLAVSASGRYIAFESKATDLSDAAQPGVTSIYLRDLKTGTTTLVSRATGADGAGADADSTSPSISPAGRYVAFESVAANLSADDDDAVRDVFVRDTVADTTTLVSRSADGTPANGDSSHPAISANGTYVAFDSVADNLSAEDRDEFSNVYRRNMETGEVAVVSKPFGGAADGNSYGPTIDRDGRHVAYTSDADNLSTKDDNAYTNVFVTDAQLGFPTAVSLPTGNFLQQLPSDGDSFDGVISADGRYVAFVSYARDLSLKDDDAYADVFRRDIQGNKTDLVSRATGPDGQRGLGSSSHPTISGDGRFVAFESAAGNLSLADGAGTDVFLRGVDGGTTTLLSREQGAAGPVGADSSYAPVLSQDGPFVAFSSDADNLSSADDDSFRNVFLRRIPVVPPPPETGPDLGSNDHSSHDPAAHAGHTADEHAGHTADEHAGHVTPTGGPAMTLFGPPVQDVDKLYMLATVHAAGKLVVTGSVTFKGRGRASKVYRFRGFTATAPAHREYRVKLTLSKSKLRAVKRALKRGKRLKAKISAKAQNAAGGPWSTVSRSVRLTN
jgi:Tol biopolymer transport system component